MERYYKQGGLKYVEEDEIIYDDSYSTSLFELFNKNKPKNTIAIQKLLDDNGYIGRSEVRRVLRTDYTSSNEARVHVQLIWSNFKYKWPLNGMWNFTELKVIYNPAPIVLPPRLLTAVHTFYETMAVGPTLLQRKADIPLKEGVKLIEVLEGMKLVKEGDFVIVDDLELQEVIDNLLNNK